jgi:heme O synthase-like polyprenyltransferase
MSSLMIPIALQGIAVIMFVQSRKQPEESWRRRLFQMSSLIFFLLSILAFVFEMAVVLPE